MYLRWVTQSDVLCTVFNLDHSKMMVKIMLHVKIKIIKIIEGFTKSVLQKLETMFETRFVQDRLSSAKAKVRKAKSMSVDHIWITLDWCTWKHLRNDELLFFSPSSCLILVICQNMCNWHFLCCIPRAYFRRSTFKCTTLSKP